MAFLLTTPRFGDLIWLSLQKGLDRFVTKLLLIQSETLEKILTLILWPLLKSLRSGLTTLWTKFFGQFLHQFDIYLYNRRFLDSNT